MTKTTEQARVADIPEWCDDLCIGHAQVDADHQALFELVATLRSSIIGEEGFDTTRHTIHRLSDYVRAHFRREERLMQEQGYPHLAHHRTEHLRFTDEVRAVEIVFEKTPERIDAAKLLDYLTTWLVSHILGSDREIGLFLQDRNAVEGDAATSNRLVDIEVSVPAAYGEVLERCARMLRRGGPYAEAVVEAVGPAAPMSYENALHTARFFLVSQAEDAPSPPPST